MKVIFFGLGSIGNRHARIIQNNFDFELFAYRSGTGPSNDLGIAEIYSWKDIEAIKPDVAFITNPTSMHIETAIRCARMGMHLFIEKPLSDRLEGLDELEALCRDKELFCYVAYCLRFHPVIKELLQVLDGKKVQHVRVSCSSYLPDWRPGFDCKKSYSASLKMGGGVLLDLSHEFDYIEYLFGPIIEASMLFGKAADITVDAEDYADGLIWTEKSIPVNLHINFISHQIERKIIVDCEDGCLIGDIANNRVELIGHKGIEVRDFKETRDDYLKEQLEYFFNNLGKKRIMNNLLDARELLEKILVIRNGNCTDTSNDMCTRRIEGREKQEYTRSLRSSTDCIYYTSGKTLGQGGTHSMFHRFRRYCFNCT